ncbi:alpha/beta hydrolase [Methylocystis parvus]|uniref:Alpha/beta hydrolase n=1 Tax=Methylocystis parvus TaxID=134 RepID=A0A6B8M5B8_9HYPH|nr:alpha/beta hydrolase [Methylocystis parvus]QGM96959.1 alpha/beta hydrolase [Methylocystis parvus]WBJ99154.1 alpha/beta hydrolase [Methylocystis parvus OBBP]
MRYALAPIIFLSLITGARADFVRDHFVFPIVGSAAECITAEGIGLPDAKPANFKTADEVELIGFHLPPQDEKKPLILYFHGQGGFRPKHFEDLVKHGYGVMAFAYRGYHTSKGSPSEQDLLKDAEAIYAKARETYLPERIVVMGESIGTGVATILASHHEEAALVLDSPYDNTPMIGWSRNFIPVFLSDFFVADKFHADDAIRNLKAPVFVSVGCKDGAIPHERGEALYELAASPKKLIAGVCVNHIPLASAEPHHTEEEKRERKEMLAKAMAWIDQPVNGGAREECPKTSPKCGEENAIPAPARAATPCAGGH